MKLLLSSCPNRPFYGSVMSIYLSVGDHSPIYFSYLDRCGVLRGYDLLPSKIANQKKEKIKSFMIEYQPEVIVINASAGQVAKQIAMLIEKELIREVQEVLQKKQNSNNNDDDGYLDNSNNIAKYETHVCIVKDEIAIIFKNSSRAKKVFPEFQPNLSAAICLGRYVQEPLAEYCNMWLASDSTHVFGMETLSLDLHPLKVSVLCCM